MGAEPMAATCRAVVQIYESSAGPVQALKGLSLDVPIGAVTAVIGPSGAGKSTLLRLLACLESPTVGEVTIGGTPTSGISSRARRRLAATRVGYVFQTPHDNLVHDLTVQEHVHLASRMRRSAQEDSGALLDAVDLSPMASARPSDLAVGEQQRLALAMAVAGEPGLVVADEPTASLDPRSARHLAELLARLAVDGRSVVVSTHDPAIIDSADHVLVIRHGVLAMEGHRGGNRLAVIDDADRLVLPADATGLLPDRRARITRHPDHLRVDPP